MSTGDIRSWLEGRFLGYRVTEDSPRRGTYAVVWILAAEDSRAHARKFALKTLAEDRKPRGREPRTIRELFVRELRLWLELPGHYHVTRALGLDFASGVSSIYAELPLVRMPYRDATLRDWIRAEATPPVVDRLMAVAEICNGLRWLNALGVEGHGDLKPENALVRNLGDTFSNLPEDRFPSLRHPWTAQLSDLGWANIWRDLGLTEKGWRPYVAPERLHGRFESPASDMFGLGVMGTELLQGMHPAGSPVEQVGKWTREKWLRWARGGRRELSGVQHAGVRQVLESCLAPQPSDRPRPDELIARVVEVIEREYHVPFQWWLDFWNTDAQKAELVGVAWGFQEAAKLGQESLDSTIQTLEQRLAALEPLESAAEPGRWLAVWQGLGRLLVRRGTPRDYERVARLATRVLRWAVHHFRDTDLREAFYYDRASHGFPESLRQEEVIEELAEEAMRQLSKAGAAEDPEFRALKTTLKQKRLEFYREIYREDLPRPVFRELFELLFEREEQ